MKRISLEEASANQAGLNVISEEELHPDNQQETRAGSRNLVDKILECPLGELPPSWLKKIIV
ncbi:hypothetical protein KKF38_01770, partial [Patescibacteria group bacterium]|nr:hypothetical protein [Patescibacteria group bacterium]